MPPTVQIWPSSAFALTTGVFYLPFGRLTDMYGAYDAFNGGLAWLCFWSLMTALSHNYVALIVFRGLAGVGAAACLPASAALVDTHFPPIPMVNFVFPVHSPFTPAGFLIGMIFSGLTSQDLAWQWYFWIGAIMLFVTFLAGLVSIPRDRRKRAPDGLTMDWAGAILMPLGLILLVYSITASSQASYLWGWPTVTFIASVGVLALAVHAEGWVADPLVPLDLFSVPGMKQLAVGLFFAYGAFGIFFFYGSFYLELVLKQVPLFTAFWYIPMIISGLVLRAIYKMTRYRLPGRVLLALPGLGLAAACIFFILMPADPNLWAFVMPAMVVASIGIDATFVICNSFITTNLPACCQGIAGAFIHSIFFLSVSVFLGFANVVVAHTSDLPSSEEYPYAFELATCLSVAGLIVFISAKKLQVG